MNARIEKYLKGYNTIQLLGWGSAFILLFINTDIAFCCIAFFQVISTAEIFHAIKKWNNSSPVFCFLQIGARLMILYFTWQLTFYKFFHSIPYLDNAIYTMLMAWSVAEVIRYAYYFSELFKIKNNKLIWLRYSAFMVCYPIGLTCEIYILIKMFTVTPVIGVKFLIILIFIAYVIAFPMLYLHLLKQRKRKLNTG